MNLSVTICLVLSVLCPPAHIVNKAQMQPIEMKDAADFLNRLKQQRHLNLLQSATWTLIHDYRDSKQMDEVLKFVQSFMEALDAYEKGNPAGLSKFGGLKRFKDQMAVWLDHNDQAIRAYAATMLGISGDRAYARQLANLLKRRKYVRDDLIQYDRGRAAMALGLVGAKEYTSSLARLLSSKESYDRAGAAYGLGFLAARAHAHAIAKLQDDKDESVREAAKEALEMMGARYLIKKKVLLRQRPREC